MAREGYKKLITKENKKKRRRRRRSNKGNKGRKKINAPAKQVERERADGGVKLPELNYQLMGAKLPDRRMKQKQKSKAREGKSDTGRVDGGRLQTETRKEEGWVDRNYEYKSMPRGAASLW